MSLCSQWLCLHPSPSQKTDDTSSAAAPVAAAATTAAVAVAVAAAATATAVGGVAAAVVPGVADRMSCVADGKMSCKQCLWHSVSGRDRLSPPGCLQDKLCVSSIPQD